MNALKNFQDNIKELMRENNESQEQFAFHISAGKSTVSGWLKQDATPSLDFLVNIADEYNISLDWLLGLSNCKEISNDVKKQKKNEPKTYKELIEQIEEMYDADIVEAHYHPEIDYIGFNNGEDSAPITMNDMYTSDMDRADIQWRRPDVLNLRDTFLSCIIIQLYYFKKEFSPDIYQNLKDTILEKYGQEELLNVDIAKENNDTINKILTKHNSYAKINLEELWNDLKQYKEKNTTP